MCLLRGGCLLWEGGSTPGGVCSGGGVCSRGVCSIEVPGGDPPTATAAGGVHPTGMHSCYNKIYLLALLFFAVLII